MEKNSDESRTVVRVSEVEKAHNSDGDGGLSSVDDEDHQHHHHNDDEVFMKNMISNHPLFGLLIETHINCLKVGMESESEDETRKEKLITDEAIKDKLNESSNIPTPELDNFMEVYCIALKKLKEAMEESVKDAKSFINDMYEQLNDL